MTLTAIDAIEHHRVRLSVVCYLDGVGCHTTVKMNVLDSFTTIDYFWPLVGSDAAGGNPTGAVFQPYLVLFQCV